MEYIFWGFVGLTIVGLWYVFGLFFRRSFVRARVARFRSSGLPFFNEQSSEGGIGTFLSDYRAGLSSRNFDISANIEDGDSRPGLDSDEVRRIMEARSVSFDKARLIRQQQLMKSNDIDPSTGVPLDPKAVTFSRPS
ncbi:hypothetical protein H4S08_002919 [Coemansia sp. RSA 1365]|nr:hypothetical protein H4S08_002919 [Coemansia sp. RSA 1365]